VNKYELLIKKLIQEYDDHVSDHGIPNDTYISGGTIVDNKIFITVSILKSLKEIRERKN